MADSTTDQTPEDEKPKKGWGDWVKDLAGSFSDTMMSDEPMKPKSLGGLFADIPLAALKIPVTLAKRVVEDPGRAMLAVSAGMFDNPQAARDLETIDTRRANAAETLKAQQAIFGYAMQQPDMTPEKAASLARLSGFPTLLTKVLGPTATKWMPMGKGGMFNPATGEVKGAPTGTDIPKGELEKRQWLAENPNDPRAPLVIKALDDLQKARIEAVGGTTRSRLEAKRGATTIGDTKDTWIANKGPYAGQKIPADTPLPVAESMGTKLSALEAKGYEGTQELLGWMKELGITPDGQISPEGQARFERLYATKPGVFRTIWNSVTRGKKLISGDPDAALVHQAVSVLTTQFAKATAGTLRVNQSELRLIKAAHPEWTDTAETAIDKLKRVTRYAAAVQQRMLGGTPAPPEDAPPFMPSLLSPGSSLPAPVTIPSDRANLFAP